MKRKRLTALPRWQIFIVYVCGMNLEAAPHDSAWWTWPIAVGGIVYLLGSMFLEPRVERSNDGRIWQVTEQP